MEQNDLTRYTDKSLQLMGYITDNAPRVFSTRAEIFPPTFPAKYTGVTAKDKIKEIEAAIGKWTASVEDLKEQVCKLNKVYLDTELQKPTTEQFVELRRALQDFTKSTTLFRQTYEDEIQIELGRRYYNLDDTIAATGVVPENAPHNAPLIGLGDLAAKCWDNHTSIFSILSEVENIWSLMQT
jgi:hypothetical protein